MNEVMKKWCRPKPEKWYLETPDEGGRIMMDDERKFVIAVPAGCPANEAIANDFRHIMKCVKAFPKMQQLLKQAAHMLRDLDDQLLAGDNPHNDNGWEDQEAFYVCEEIEKTLKENENE